MTSAMPSSGTWWGQRGQRWGHPQVAGPRGGAGAHQGVIEVEGADVIGRNVGGGQRLGDLRHDATFVCGAKGPQGEWWPQWHSPSGGCTGGHTATAATLTEAKGLPPDPHHAPQLPRRAGQQQVAGEPERGGTERDPNLPEPPALGRTRRQTDSTYRFWVSASMTMEM